MIEMTFRLSGNGDTVSTLEKEQLEEMVQDIQGVPKKFKFTGWMNVEIGNTYSLYVKHMGDRINEEGMMNLTKAVWEIVSNHVTVKDVAISTLIVLEFEDLFKPRDMSRVG